MMIKYLTTAIATAASCIPGCAPTDDAPPPPPPPCIASVMLSDAGQTSPCNLNQPQTLSYLMLDPGPFQYEECLNYGGAIFTNDSGDIICYDIDY